MISIIWVVTIYVAEVFLGTWEPKVSTMDSAIRYQSHIFFYSLSSWKRVTKGKTSTYQFVETFPLIYVLFTNSEEVGLTANAQWI